MSDNNEPIVCVIGVDEVGRGPLAGPITTCACWLNPDWERDTIKDDQFFDGIRDSKLFGKSSKRSLQERKAISDFLNRVSMEEEQHVVYSMTSIPASRINELQHEGGILAATYEGWTHDIVTVKEQLEQRFQKLGQSIHIHVIIDGDRIPPQVKKWISTTFRVTAMVGGDAKVKAISAASIIAKEWRDDYMTNVLAKKYPQYGFEQHFGYGSEHHTKMLHKYGKSKCHRYFSIPAQTSWDKVKTKKEKTEPVSNSKKRKLVTEEKPNATNVDPTSPIPMIKQEPGVDTDDADDDVPLGHGRRKRIKT